MLKSIMISLVMFFVLATTALAGNPLDVELSNCKQAGTYMECKLVVRNNTDRDISYIYLNFAFKDKDLNVLGYDWTNMTNIPAHSFKVKTLYADDIDASRADGYSWSVGGIR